MPLTAPCISLGTMSRAPGRPVLYRSGHVTGNPRGQSYINPLGQSYMGEPSLIPRHSEMYKHSHMFKELELTWLATPSVPVLSQCHGMSGGQSYTRSAMSWESGSPVLYTSGNANAYTRGGAGIPGPGVQLNIEFP